MPRKRDKYTLCTGIVVSSASRSQCLHHAYHTLIPLDFLLWCAGFFTAGPSRRFSVHVTVNIRARMRSATLFFISCTPKRELTFEALSLPLKRIMPVGVRRWVSTCRVGVPLLWGVQSNSWILHPKIFLPFYQPPHKDETLLVDLSASRSTECWTIVEHAQISRGYERRAVRCWFIVEANITTLKLHHWLKAPRQSRTTACPPNIIELLRVVRETPSGKVWSKRRRGWSPGELGTCISWNYYVCLWTEGSQSWQDRRARVLSVFYMNLKRKRGRGRGHNIIVICRNQHNKLLLACRKSITFWMKSYQLLFLAR